jgi:hypothetical protein
MTTRKPKSTARKAKNSSPATAKKPSAGVSMSDSQKTIYNKLKRKGMTDKQAHAFSKHAARRKDSAAAKKSPARKKK